MFSFNLEPNQVNSIRFRNACQFVTQWYTVLGQLEFFDYLKGYAIIDYFNELQIFSQKHPMTIKYIYQKVK